MIRSNKLFYLVLVFILSPLFTFSEGIDSLLFKTIPDTLEPPVKKSKIGWEISGNFGVYKANRYQAQFYNGSPENVNNLNYVLSNYYWRQDIVNQLIQYEQRDSFVVVDFPARIKYDAAMHVGFSARYNYSEELTLNISFNFSKLRIRDAITCEVFPPFSGMVQSYVYFNVFAEEARTNMDIGAMYTVSPEKKTTPFAEMGLHLNSTHVKSHIMKVYDKEFNMVNIYGSSGYIPGAPLNEYDIRQGGIGFGTYVSGGIRYAMSDQFSLELAGIIYLKTVGLEGYRKRLNLHEAVLVRMVMSPFFNFSGEEPTLK
jgi:hypothetical protein